MKKLLLLLLLLPISFLAQTSFSEVEIDAASGNGYETLMCNVEYGFQDVSIQSFLQTELKMYMVSNNHDKWLFEKVEYTFASKLRQGKEKERFLNYTIYRKKHPKFPDNTGIVEKVVITGDWNDIVSFFVGYWSRTVNLGDVAVGEIASTRFLTDVATIRYEADGTGTITVVSAKDR